jgi:hypothetical protein
MSDDVEQEPSTVLSPSLLAGIDDFNLVAMAEGVRGAQRIVGPFLVEDGEDGVGFPVNGEMRYIRSDAPAAVVHASMLLWVWESMPAIVANGNYLEITKSCQFLCASAFYLVHAYIGGKVGIGQAIEEYVNEKDDQIEAGEDTALIQTTDEIENLLLTYKKYEGKYGQYSNTAKDLFKQGIKGRGGKKEMSPRSVKRYIDTLKKKSDRPNDVDNGSVA